MCLLFIYSLLVVLRPLNYESSLSSSSFSFYSYRNEYSKLSSHIYQHNTFRSHCHFPLLLLCQIPILFLSLLFLSLSMSLSFSLVIVLAVATGVVVVIVVAVLFLFYAIILSFIINDTAITIITEITTVTTITMISYKK